MNMYILLVSINVLGLITVVVKWDDWEGFAAILGLCWVMGVVITGDFVHYGYEKGFPVLDLRDGVLHYIGAVLTFGPLLIPKLPKCLEVLGSMSKVLEK